MKYLIYLISIILLIGLNLGFFANLQIQSQIPNLLLVFTICASLEKKNYDFFFIAFVSGLFLDFYSVSFFGTFTISLLLVALSLHFLANIVVVLELDWKFLGLVLLAALILLDLFSWAYGLGAYKFNWSPDSTVFKVFLGAFSVQFFYNLLILYPVYIFYNFVKRFIDSLSTRSRGIVH